MFCIFDSLNMTQNRLSLNILPSFITICNRHHNTKFGKGSGKTLQSMLQSRAEPEHHHHTAILLPSLSFKLCFFSFPGWIKFGQDPRGHSLLISPKNALLDMWLNAKLKKEMESSIKCVLKELLKCAFW